MLKKITALLSCAALLLCLCAFSSCRKMDRYRAYIPNDQPYYAVLNYINHGENYDWEYNYAVTQTKAFIAGAERDVIYIEYSLDDNYEPSNHRYDKNYTLIYVASKSFYLDGSEWKEDISSLWTKWSEVYGSMSKPGTFVDFMVNGVWDRDFPQDIKTTTDDYIEYKFKYDEEVFRLSNNEYHYIVYYHIKTDKIEITQNATVTFGTPNILIPQLDTITAEMLATSD